MGDNPGIWGWGLQKAIPSLPPSSNHWIPNYRLVSGDLPGCLRCVWGLSSVVAWAWCLPLVNAAVVGGGESNWGFSQTCLSRQGAVMSEFRLCMTSQCLKDPVICLCCNRYKSNYILILLEGEAREEREKQEKKKG